MLEKLAKIKKSHKNSVFIISMIIINMLQICLFSWSNSKFQLLKMICSFEHSYTHEVFNFMAFFPCSPSVQNETLQVLASVLKETRSTCICFIKRHITLRKHFFSFLACWNSNLTNWFHLCSSTFQFHGSCVFHSERKISHLIHYKWLEIYLVL